MDWSPQQLEAIDKVQSWYRSPGRKPFFFLGGYAGTGKTTLARHLAEIIGGNVVFGAYTGKAAYVLQRSGCPNAMTLHQMMYAPMPEIRAELEDLEKQLTRARSALANAGADAEDVAMDPAVMELESRIAAERKRLSSPRFQLNPRQTTLQADCICIDEGSMVGEDIGQDILSLGIPLLVLGDPMQLPPVKRRPFFGEDTDFTLTEIHRQAQGNPIIEMATKVRNGDLLEHGEYGNSRVVGRGALSHEDVLAHDQIIVGTNKSRRSLNHRVRELKGLLAKSPFPVAQDRLVCLRNDHERGFLNGSQWTVLDVDPISDPDEDDPSIALTVVSHGGPPDESPVLVEAHYNGFLPSNQDERRRFRFPEDTPLQKQLLWSERQGCMEFDYAYAMTCHKAQGSQWGSVLVLDESWGKDKDRWLYTAITRAEERVTIVR